MIELSNLSNNEIECLFVDRLNELAKTPFNQHDDRWGIFFKFPHQIKRIHLGTKTTWSSKGSASRDLWEFIGGVRWADRAKWSINNDPVFGAQQFRKAFGPLINKYIEIRLLKDDEF